MANTVPAEVVLPDPLSFYPGQPLRATAIRYLLGSLNAATAELHASTVISQQWMSGVASHAGATPEDGDEVPIPLAFWRLPVSSDRHTILRILARAERSNDDNVATLTLRSRHAEDEVSVELDVDAEDDWIEVGELTIATGEDEDFEDVTAYLATAGAGTTARLYQLVATVKPLASPLPAQTVSGAVPFGLGASCDVDRPLPAARGHQIIDTLTALYARPRVMQSWSGLSAEYSGVDATSEAMPEHGVVSMSPAGRARSGNPWRRPTGYAFGLTAADVLIQTAPPALRDATVALAAGFEGWFELTGNANLPFGDVAPVEVAAGVVLAPQTTVEGAGPRAGLHPGPSAIRSLTLWGV